MRIFALETNPQRIIEHFASRGEQVLLMSRYHWMSFVIAIFDEFLLLCILSSAVLWPLSQGVSIDAVVWGIIACAYMYLFFRTLKAFIDWRYDFLFLTTDKIVLVNQTSVIRQEVKPIHLENVGGVSTCTQLLGLFHFGAVTLHLKEGLGGDTVTRRYIPHAKHVASSIADAVTRFQRTSERGS